MVDYEALRKRLSNAAGMDLTLKEGLRYHYLYKRKSTTEMAQLVDGICSWSTLRALLKKFNLTLRPRGGVQKRQEKT